MLRAKLYGLLSASIFLLISGTSLASPDDLNQISGITVTEEADETVILISADHTPTFSVFKLDEPVRLFVDVSLADASKVSDPVVVDNGVLDQVVGMQIKSNGTPVGRIVIGLRQNAAYDVKATPDGIVVRVDGAGRRPASGDADRLNAEVAQIKAELAREKDLLEKIRQNRDREAGLRISEEQSRLEAERLRAKAEELKTTAETEAREAARLAQEEKARLEDTRKARVAEEKSIAQLNTLKAQESAKLDEVRKARELEERLTAQLADARKNNENRKAAAIQDEIEKARADKAAQEKQMAALGQKIEAAKAESAKAAELARQAERLEARVKQEKDELARITREREEASKAWSQTVAKLETEEKRLEAIGRSRVMAEQEVASLRAEVENLKDSRKAVETDEARRLREEIEARETELKQLRARADAAGEAVQTAEVRLNAKEKELGDLKAGLEQERAAHQAKLAAEKKASDAEIAAREKEIAQLKAEADRARKAAAEADGQMTMSQKDAVARLDAKEKELAAAREEAKKAASKSEARAAAEKAEADARLAAREKEIQSLRADMEAAKLAAAQEGRNKALAEQEKAVAELRGRYEESLADVKELARRQEQQIRDLSVQVENAQDDAQKARGEVARAQDDAQKARGEVARAQDDAQKARGEVARAQDDAQKARGEVAAREQRIAELQAELETLQKNSSATESKEVARLQKLVNQKEAEVSKLSKASADTSKLDEARAELAAYESAMAAAREREEAALSKERAAAAKIAELSQEARENDQRLSAKQAEVERLKAELAAAKESGKVADKQARAEADREIARLAKELENARAAEMKAAKATNAAAQAEIDRLKNELAAAKKATPKDSPKAETLVRAIDFKNTGNGPSVVLAIDGDADYSVTSRDGAYILTIDGAKLPKDLARRLDVTAFGTAVAMISSFTLESGKVQVVATLDKPVGQNLARQGGKLVWTFAGPATTDLMAGAVPTPRVGPTVAQAAPAAQTAPAAKGPTPEMAEDPKTADGQGYLKPSMVPKKKKYQGRRINLTVKDADIQNVLTFLAREGRVNIVTSEEVKGKVTFHLEDVPWDLALDTVLKAKGLDYVVEQGIYRVASSESIQREYEAKVEKAKKQRELKPVVVRLVPVNYGKGTEMASRVKDVLSDKGSVSVDERTNTLVIKDTEDYLAAAEELVTRLDQQTPQILIEARIVEARTTFSEDIGIQWGGNFSMSSAFGNETGTAFPSSIGLAGGNGEADPSGGISLDNPNWAVNLPAAVGTGSGGAIGIQLGSIGGIGNLTLRLSAAEENGDVKIISSPRISTLDNRKASISQGVQIPISVVSAAGVNTQFFAADLRLDVEPHVTRDGHINLKLDITKNEPDFGNLAANGNPTIQKKEAHTELLIRDGDTTVIGGIYTRSTGKSFKKIPFLGDIPVLGWLFKSRNRSDDRSELLIFITPKVVNREVSL